MDKVRLGERTFNNTEDCMEESNIFNHTRTVTCADPYIDVKVEKVLIHPRYDNNEMIHDICLLRLSQTVNFTSKSHTYICDRAIAKWIAIHVLLQCYAFT